MNDHRNPPADWATATFLSDRFVCKRKEMPVRKSVSDDIDSIDKAFTSSLKRSTGTTNLVLQCRLAESNQYVEAVSPTSLPGLTRCNTSESSSIPTPTSAQSYPPFDQADRELKGLLKQLWHTDFPDDLDLLDFESPIPTSANRATWPSLFGAPEIGSEETSEPALNIPSDSLSEPSDQAASGTSAVKASPTRSNSLCVLTQQIESPAATAKTFLTTSESPSNPTTETDSDTSTGKASRACSSDLSLLPRRSESDTSTVKAASRACSRSLSFLPSQNESHTTSARESLTCSDGLCILRQNGSRTATELPSLTQCSSLSDQSHLTDSDVTTESESSTDSDILSISPPKTSENPHSFGPLQIRYSYLGPSIPKAPPRSPRQLCDRQGFSYTEVGLITYDAAAERSETAIDRKKRALGEGISWAGYGNRSLHTLELLSSETRKGLDRPFTCIVEGQHKLDYPVHPSDMIGEGCYRISKHASNEQMVESFRTNLGPLAPLVVNLAGRDTKVRGHAFTHNELQRWIYEHETCSRRQIGLKITTTDEGLEVHRGFPADKVMKKNHDSDHLRGQWWEIVPSLSEHKIAHLRTAPVNIDPKVLARINEELVPTTQKRSEILPPSKAAPPKCPPLQQRVRFAEAPQRFT
ncbi:hypothetical protein MMC13_008267 [Lambiella insularis]|nr:hypothetical protein [Lambiella insularis]